MTLNIPDAFPLLGRGETLHVKTDDGARSGTLRRGAEYPDFDPDLPTLTDGVRAWYWNGHCVYPEFGEATSLVIMHDGQEVASVEWRDGKAVRVEIEAASAIAIAWLRRDINTLQGKIAALRAFRVQQDCRFTAGDVADIDGSHCQMDKPCVRCQMERLRAENERLREALNTISKEDDQPVCCGNGTYGDAFNPPECCNNPTYGFDRAQSVARAALKENGNG